LKTKEEMPKSGKLFERVPLEKVPNFQKLKPADRTKPAKAQTASTVRKNVALAKRTTGTDANDHAVGLWIDTALFRKHRNRTPQIVLHDPLQSRNNRYLALADLAFNNNRRVK
jgi:hypothetical protein